MQETLVQFLPGLGSSPGEGIGYPLQDSQASLVAQMVKIKKSTHNVGDLGSIPELGRSPGEGIGYPLQYSQASLVAQMVKNLPAMWDTWVQSLNWEDTLEKEITTHTSSHFYMIN